MYTVWVWRDAPGAEWIQNKGTCMYLGTWILNCTQEEPAKDLKVGP